MSNIGRNDPCPCGSGKKYKKCCLGKDEPVLEAQAPAGPADDNSESEPYEGESGIRNAGWECESDTPEDPVSEPETKDAGPVFPEPPEEALSPLSPDQDRLVDEWWKVEKPLFRKRDAEALLRHLNGFWALHPDLIPYLELEMEFLFELGADLGRQKEWPRFAELLVRLRGEHPVAYLRSFGYFDRYLIIEALAQGRTEEIPRLFDLFHRYPTGDYDNADRIINLLAWEGAEAALLEFVKPLRQEPHGPGLSLSPSWLHFGLMIPHLDAATDPDVATECVIKEVKNLNVPQLSNQNATWLRMTFDCARQTFKLPDYESCRTREAVQSYFDHVTWNFLSFLHKAKGLPWARAFFLGSRSRGGCITSYLHLFG